MGYQPKPQPNYPVMEDTVFYASHATTEYQQSVEEGLDIERYKDLFTVVAALPKDEIKQRLGDVLYEIISNAKTKESYPYVEPSDLSEIRALRVRPETLGKVNPDTLEAKTHGAWMGRICGCLLGKTVEGIRTNELTPFLQETDNYPMHRYILRSDVTEETIQKYTFPFAHVPYADTVDGMPVDDDTNYVIMAQEIIKNHGRDFTPQNVADAWIHYQSRNAYFTAERVTFRNLINGFTPPASAMYKNPFREWIGAQIRGDYFGYINPGNPETAAEMAFRDASISHIKNGIYGEMFVAAMIAVAAVTDDIETIILGGLGEIPHTSRLYESIMEVMGHYKRGGSQADCFAMIHKVYDEHTGHGWCHTISNAMIVAASLLYGGGNFGKSICMAVETGFDTDCNGATVGSVLGMARGIEGIPACWQSPINDTLHTSIFGVGTVKISDRVKMTLTHINA